VFGDGVNVAARLQNLAEPDSICLSHIVYKEVEKKLPLGAVVSLGHPKLKNITERFAVSALLSAPRTPSDRTSAAAPTTTVAASVTSGCPRTVF
jgi:class 3 adenylate cyclase